jgi:hypothetical protein
MAITIEQIAAIIAKITKAESVIDEVKAAGTTFAYELLSQYDWHQLRGSATKTTTSGTATYALQGASKDCGKLIMLLYETFEIGYVPQEEFYRRNQGTQLSQIPVSMWTISGYDVEGFPVVKLSGTPQVSGETIEYVYTKRIDETDPFKDLPAFMMNIIRLRMLAEFYPYPAKSEQYAKLAQEAIDRALWIQKEKEGLNVRMQQDPDRALSNQLANDLAARRHYSGRIG